MFDRFIVLGLVVIGITFNEANCEGQTIQVPLSVLDGSAPGIKLNDFPPKSRVLVHVIRRLEKYEADAGGNWQQVKKSLHAWAGFITDEVGQVNVDTATPFEGTYNSPDPLALLRTGYYFGDPNLKNVRQFTDLELTDAAADDVLIKVEQDGDIIAEAQFNLLAEIEGLEFETVSIPGLNGVFARPKKDGRLPVVISLHGSEGGSAAKARGRAAIFASNGFATLAINYFAYPYEGIGGVPTSHIETPIEMVEKARQWLSKRPDVDLDRVSLYGVSKGAEFACVAATKYDWIESVIAVVPCDIVWAGYGEEFLNSEQKSSWSFDGKPLAFVPLFPFDPRKTGLYRTNTERYSRSRKFYRDSVAGARIPIEKSSARLLLLASDRDEVWASGEMARNLVERFVDAGKPGQVSVRIFPLAGHQIAGTGTFPIRLYGVQSEDANAKDLVAEGQSAGESWKLTLEFLNRVDPRQSPKQ